MNRISLLACVLAALVLSALVTGCGSLPFLAPPTPTPLPTATPTTVPTATPAPPTATPSRVPTAAPTMPPTPANPVAGLNSVFKNWGAVKSFRASIVTTGTAAGTATMNMEVVLPDKFHITSAAMEIIMIGKTTYVKIQNKWQKMALPAGFDLSVADPKVLAAQLTTTSDVKMVGTEVLNGTPTLVYTYTTTVKGPPAVTTSHKVWSGALDGLPLKMESSSKAGQLTTITYSDYNANIAITAPM